ncbi:uncharacterized protein [Clytia hemisphaerica]|uniref:uncharacterized protein n=1 Tax=Clytia hemisphaerica TaxID=252671 RepID=UPI0034D5CCDB
MTAVEKLLKLYSAWSCPYAQRAWIGLLFKEIPFDYIEQDPYNKTPEWLAINPRGLVPAMVLADGKVVYESSICLEYLDEAYPETANQILPKDAYQRAYCRIWGDFVSGNIGAPLYAILSKKGEEREESKKKLVAKLEQFMKEFKGPFFNGDHFGYVDIMVVPFLLRLDVLKHFRNFHPADEIPDATLKQRFLDWDKALRNHHAVAPTIATVQQFVEKYNGKYDD